MIQFLADSAPCDRLVATQQNTEPSHEMRLTIDSILNFFVNNAIFCYWLKFCVDPSFH